MTVTRQWQVYLPQDIRTALKLTEPTRIKAETEGEKVILTRHDSPVLKLAGSLKKYAKKGRKINLDRIRDYIDYSQL